MKKRKKRKQQFQNKQTNKQTNKHGVAGEELLGPQAKWRVMPWPQRSNLPPEERLFDPQAILE